MNENIDLTKILKDCPKGTKFYSTLYGEVEFEKIKKESEYPIVIITKLGYTTGLTKEGFYLEGRGECTLFPSKDQRDWSKFTAPWYKKKKFNPKTLQPFDKVLVYNETSWQVEFFSHIYPQDPEGWCQCTGDIYEFCIPYNDDTKHLVSTKDEAPEYYRYWED